MKTWTEQLIDGEKLWGFLLTIDKERNNQIIKKLIDFKKEDINNKFAIYEDSGLPTLIKL